MLLVLLFSCLGISGQTLIEQVRKAEVRTSLDVRWSKTEYTLYEPIALTLDIGLMPNDRMPRVSEAITVRIEHQGITKEHHGLTSSVISGPGDAMPQVPAEGEKAETARHFERVEMIDRVDEFFPEPGQYSVEFGLNGARSGATVITIVEPMGTNRQAYLFLSNFRHPLTFRWVFETPNGIELLEDFVKKHRGSVYGDSAAYQLGQIYFYRGKFEKARTIFKELGASNNIVIARLATQSLRDVENNIRMKSAADN